MRPDGAERGRIHQLDTGVLTAALLRAKGVQSAYHRAVCFGASQGCGYIRIGAIVVHLIHKGCPLRQKLLAYIQLGRVEDGIKDPPANACMKTGVLHRIHSALYRPVHGVHLTKRATKQQDAGSVFVWKCLPLCEAA